MFKKIFSFFLPLECLFQLKILRTDLSDLLCISDSYLIKESQITLLINSPYSFLMLLMSIVYHFSLDIIRLIVKVSGKRVKIGKITPRTGLDGSITMVSEPVFGSVPITNGCF